MSKKKKKRTPRRERKGTPLDKHRRHGKTLSPPLLNLSAPMVQVPWLADLFPDQLWVCSMLTDRSDKEGMLRIARVLDVISESLGENEPNTVIDGRLSSFELLNEQDRHAALFALRDSGVYDVAVSDDFAIALSMYPDAPASWLVRAAVEERSLRVDPERAQSYLSRVIRANDHGQAVLPTRAKVLAIRSLLKARKLSMPPSIADDLGPAGERYPDITDDERKKFESTIRAMFGSLFGLEGDDDPHHSIAKVWAPEFWRSNWRMYQCIEGNAGGSSSGRDPTEQVAAIRHSVSELEKDFLGLVRSVDPDLYDPDRHEVLTGIFANALGATKLAVHSPAMWSVQNGRLLLRTVLESLITMRWLSHNDHASTYADFKAYGRGHLKLLKLHLEDYLDAHSEGTHAESLKAELEFIDFLVNQDLSEEFQDISVKSTFSGKSIRDMALEVGMEDEYRLIYAPASSVVHAEWQTLDRYALTRCLNPLHRWHRIPAKLTGYQVDIGAIYSSVSFLAATLEECRALLSDAGGSAATA